MTDEAVAVLQFVTPSSRAGYGGRQRCAIHVLKRRRLSLTLDPRHPAECVVVDVRRGSVLDLLDHLAALVVHAPKVMEDLVSWLDVVDGLHKEALIVELPFSHGEVARTRVDETARIVVEKSHGGGADDGRCTLVVGNGDVFA